MKGEMRFRFWLEISMATITGLLFVVTLIWRNWIEIVFNVSLDNGTGSFEWLVVGVLFVATIALSILARNEWRRAQTTISTPESVQA
jgi:tetrahydromethanopterin S-methyltransferase subunit E